MHSDNFLQLSLSGCGLVISGLLSGTYLALDETTPTLLPSVGFFKDTANKYISSVEPEEKIPAIGMGVVV